MERKRLKKELGKLLGDYVGIRLRENDFDPQGKKRNTFLDNLVHYDLAINVALPWLSDSDDPVPWKKEKMKLPLCRRHIHPNRTEREAMILSSFAGMLMNSIPIDDVIRIYNTGPSTTCYQNSGKGHWIHPCNLSLHPFAMLTAPQAAEYAWKQSVKFQRATTNRNDTSDSTKRMDIST
uniref:Chromosome 2 open reading frame 80 n=1 Tax=Salvator merianae TaxID=96440 RepID=A0A8D0E581_SALMN